MKQNTRNITTAMPKAITEETMVSSVSGGSKNNIAAPTMTKRASTM